MRQHSDWVEDDRDYGRIRDAIRYLVVHADRQPELAELAGALHLSESRLQRLFTRWAGVSPKRFAATDLRGGQGAAQGWPGRAVAVPRTGFVRRRRLHDLFVTLEAMTPGEYRNGGAGLDMEWSVEASRFGPVLVARTARGVCAAQFVADEMEAAAWLRQRWPNAALKHRLAAARRWPPRCSNPCRPMARRRWPCGCKAAIFRSRSGVRYCRFPTALSPAMARSPRRWGGRAPRARWAARWAPIRWPG